MGTINNDPKIRGSSILLVRSFSNSFQPLLRMAKQTPIPEIMNRSGMRQILIRPMANQMLSPGLTLDKINKVSPGLENNTDVVDY